MAIVQPLGKASAVDWSKVPTGYTGKVSGVSGSGTTAQTPTKTIEDYKKDYAEASARGDAAGMKAANDGANAIRAAQGQAAQYATADIARVAAQSSGGVAAATPKSSGTSESPTLFSNPSGVSGSSAASGTNPNLIGATTADDFSRIYFEARARGDADTMEAANRAANKLKGLGDVVTAGDDIAMIRRLSSGQGIGSDILSLGQGPLSQEGVEKYFSSNQSPTTAGFVLGHLPSETQDTKLLTSETAQDTGLVDLPYNKGEDSSYALTEYLKAQKAAELESALAGLKGAYEQSMAGYQSAKDRLPQAYEAARNAAAAQNAIAKRAFDERAEASGLNSGTAGQAELSRSSALRAALSGIDQQQANATANMDLQMETLKSQYQTAIQQARANGNSTLATALYQELLRVQGLERQDAQLEKQDALDAEALAYEREQTARAEAQQRIKEYLSALGTVSGLDSALVEQSGYTAGELNALEVYYAQQTEESKPTLTEAAVRANIKAGNLSPSVLSAYEYYYGVPYGGAGYSSGSTPSSVGAGYDNGSLSAAQVKELQAHNGLTVDGYWGPNSQKTTGMTADQAWSKYLQEKTGAPESAKLLNKFGNGWIEIGGSRISLQEVESSVESGEIVEIYDKANNTVKYVYA